MQPMSETTPTRRNLRYELFRQQKATRSEIPALPLTDEAVRVSRDPKFRRAGGWPTFGLAWDISDAAPFAVVFLLEPLERAWDEEVKGLIQELPSPPVKQGRPKPRRKNLTVDVTLKREGDL